MRAWQRVARVVALVGAATLVLGGVAGARTSSQAPTQAPNQADDPTERPRTIDVVGTGQVRGVPDVLSLTLGVSTRDKSAGTALTHNSELTSQLIGVLRDAGVDDKDVQTTNLSISPVYDDDGENVIGYGVTNTVDVQIRDLNKAGPIVDAAAEVAGDEIVVNSLYFSFDDDSDLVAQARAEAVKRARTQAEQLAKAAGVELGDVLTISESTSSVGPVIDAAPRAASAEDSSSVPPIQPGSESLAVQVNLSYEIT
jgi:uncharacterized protein